MKKNGIILIVAVAVSAIVGAITAVVSLSLGGDTTLKEVVYTPDSGHVAEPRPQVVLSNTDYPDLTFAAESAVRSVVHIETTIDVGYMEYDPIMEFFGFGPQPGTMEATAGGSGVIISEDGYIVTNDHVLENAKRVRVTLYDGRKFDATIVGTDPDTDVALIKIDATELAVMPFGSSDDLRLGEWVLAIGYPMELQTTVTAGIVSAKARHLGAISERTGIESFIQTDAAVNPGNSGGALVNTRGELVGINTLIKTSTGSFVGYSFAVPETIVRKVTTDLIETGSVQRAVLGISFTEVDQELVDKAGYQYDIDEVHGIFVSGVARGGAAEMAGIAVGDIIVSFDGVDVNDSSTLLEQVSKHRPGDVVTLGLRREGRAFEVEVTLQNRYGETTMRKSSHHR